MGRAHTLLLYNTNTESFTRTYRASVGGPGRFVGVEDGIALPRTCVGDFALTARSEGRGGGKGVGHVRHFRNVPRVEPNPGELRRALERGLQQGDPGRTPPTQVSVHFTRLEKGADQIGDGGSDPQM